MDGIHLNCPGYAYLAGVMKATIKELGLLRTGARGAPEGTRR